MDLAVTKFLGVEKKCTYFQDTDFTFGRGEDLIGYIRSVYRTHGKDTKMMTLPISMIEYFTGFRDDILQCAKLTCFEDISVKHILSFMGKKGYKNGIGAMSAEERMAVDEKIAAANAAKRDAKWTEEVDATIERLIGDGVSYAKIALELGNGLSKSEIAHRWNAHLKEKSGIIKPPMKTGPLSKITWTEEVDATIERLIGDGVSYTKIALELGDGLSKNDIAHRWNRHLKVKLQ